MPKKEFSMRMSAELKARYEALSDLLSEIEKRKVPVSELVEKASRIGLPALEAEAHRLKIDKEHQELVLAEQADQTAATVPTIEGGHAAAKKRKPKKYPPLRRRR